MSKETENNSSNDDDNGDSNRSSTTPVTAPVPATVTIEHLTLDCLQNIFNYLPVVKLNELELLSPRWKPLIEYINQQQTTLKLFDTIDNLNHYYVNNDHKFYYQSKTMCKYYHQYSNDFIIVGDCLNQLSCQLILLKYPNLRMLLIHFCRWKFADLWLLISELKQLQCLTLSVKMNNEGDNSLTLTNVKKLCYRLNELKGLKHFTLNLQPMNQSNFQTIINPFRPDFMKNIEHLNFNLISLNYNEYFSGLQPSDSLKLKALTLKCYDLIKMSQATIELLAKSIEYLSLNYSIEDNKYLSVPYTQRKFSLEFNSICHYFNGVKYLEIFIDFNIDLKYLHTQLCKLLNLSEFRLISNDLSISINDDDNNTGNGTDFDYYSPLKSIRTLYLDIDFELVTFSKIVEMFPKVEYLTINTSRLCCICPPEPETPAAPPPPPQLPPPAPASSVAEPQEAGAQAAPPVQLPPAEPAEGQQPLEQPQLPPQPPPPPPGPSEPPANDDVEYEIDNCVKCTREMLKLLIQNWSQLKHLKLIGDRLKEESFIELKLAPNLQILTIMINTNTSNEIRLKSILNICYDIAKGRITNNNDGGNHGDSGDGKGGNNNGDGGNYHENTSSSKQSIQSTFTLKLNEKLFKKIIKLPLKPRNLFIYNVNAIVD